MMTRDMKIAFTKVKLPYGWLGNMAPYALVYEGKEWKTSEALFQARRFDKYDPIREQIRAEKSPMAAKLLAKSSVERMVVVPQSEEDLKLMAEVLRLKVEEHPILKQWLLETGDAEIIEDCTKRQRGSGLFWGAGLQEDGTWKGDNYLGKLWMLLRRELRGE